MQRAEGGDFGVGAGNDRYVYGRNSVRFLEGRLNFAVIVFQVLLNVRGRFGFLSLEFRRRSSIFIPEGRGLVSL